MKKDVLTFTAAIAWCLIGINFVTLILFLTLYSIIKFW